MPPTRLPLVIRLGGIRSLLSFCAIMTAGLAAALSPVAVAVWVPSLAALALLPALLGVGGVGYYLWRGLSARRMFKQALRHYARVTDDYEATELQVRLVPEGESHGARVMADYRWLRDEYENLTRSWQDFGSPRGAQWFEPGMLGRVAELEQRSAALGSTEDVIVGHAAFLTLSSRWERIWYDEQRPVLEDLDLLLALCQWVDSSTLAPVGTVEARELVRAHHQRLSEMTTELSAGLLKPSAALDELAWIRADVRRSANVLEWTAAGVDSPLGPTDPDVQHWMHASEGVDVVKPGGDAESLDYAGAYAAAGVGIGPHAPMRRGFLGDGTFPGR